MAKEITYRENLIILNSPDDVQAFVLNEDGEIEDNTFDSLEEAKNGLITIKGKMGNKKLSTDMARYIWSIIVKEPLLPMSWGVDLETVVCSEDALEFHVQGFLHTGNVRIVYIEGADIFQVLLYDEEGNLLKQIDDVYLDNLAETIDLNVENDKVENYNAKVMNFLIGA